MVPVRLIRWHTHVESCFRRKSHSVLGTSQRCFRTDIGKCSYSVESKGDNSKQKFTATLENIFSEDNKKRVQQSLLFQPQKQVRAVQMVENPKQAAVLVPLCLVNGHPSILFMVRSKEIKKHRGEICFPGGMMDSTDPDLIYTAIRETHEEISLSESCVDVWGHMNQIPNRDGSTLVTPVLGTCGEINVKDLILNPHEAEGVFTCRIADLCHLDNVGSTQFRRGNGFTLPVFKCGKRHIWGLTAIFLHQTLTIIAPGLYRFKLRHRS